MMMVMMVVTFMVVIVVMLVLLMIMLVMVLVPLLLWLVRLEDKAAFSSAVAVILPLCAVSIAVYAVHDSLPLRDALPYLIGGAAGGVLAGLWFRKIPAKALHLILGGVILAGGVRLIVC